jgi:hypothetical protein
MILKSLTKDQLNLVHDPLFNKGWGLDSLIYEAQMEGLTELTLNPPWLVPKEVTGVFKSNPYNFAITESNQPNNMVSVTKISWV